MLLLKKRAEAHSSAPDSTLTAGAFTQGPGLFPCNFRSPAQAPGSEQALQDEGNGHSSPYGTWLGAGGGGVGGEKGKRRGGGGSPYLRKTPAAPPSPLPRPPAGRGAPRDRPGPSAVRTPGASTRPQASGAPREGPRGLRQRPRGGGREPGRAGGGPSSGPPPSGAEAAPRRAVSLTFWQRRQRARIGGPAQRDRRPETSDLGGAARGR